jgi:hypothetical protein
VFGVPCHLDRVLANLAPISKVLRLTPYPGPQKATNGEIAGDAVDLGVVAAVAPVAPVA